MYWQLHLNLNRFEYKIEANALVEVGNNAVWDKTYQMVKTVSDKSEKRKMGTKGGFQFQSEQTFKGYTLNAKQRV